MSFFSHDFSRLGVCPFSVLVFAATAAVTTRLLRRRQQPTEGDADGAADSTLPPCQVVFVLGAPGSGKGTQCQLLVERLQGPWTHLSAGDLLRAARNASPASGDDNGVSRQLSETIQACMGAGQLVPSHVTCQLLEQGMLHAFRRNRKCTRFLIDGFPRSVDNLQAWNNSPTASKHKVEFCLNLECPQEVLLGRLLERGKQAAASGVARADDTPAIIQKRFESHVKDTAPIVEDYRRQGKLKTVLSDKPVQQVLNDVVACFEVH